MIRQQQNTNLEAAKQRLEHYVQIRHLVPPFLLGGNKVPPVQPGQPPEEAKRTKAELFI